MSNKKNIDQLFKDRFQNLETPPPAQVWDNIQAQLPAQKRDRKVIPLWWKLGGIAAALVLFFAVGNVFFTNPAIDDAQYVDEDKAIDKASEILKTQKTVDTKDNAVQVAEQNIYNESTETVDVASNDFQEAVVNANSTISADKNNHVATKATNSTKSNDAERAGNPWSPRSSHDVIQNKESLNKGYAVNDPKTQESRTENKNPSSIENREKVIGNNNDLNNANTEGYAIDTNQEKNVEQTNESQVLDKDKISIFDAIEESKEAVADVKMPYAGNRWEVAPNVAPVYYNSLSNGSSIDASFADNAQSGDVNVSYGVNVAYQINSKLSVRSGISNVNLSYGTGGLELGTGDTSAALQSINYGNEINGIILTAVDQGAIQTAPDGSPFANLTRKATSGDVILTQNISYLEIPTELKYSILDKKLGIDVIGGFSTLLLGDNEVSVASDDFNSVLGEANNLSDVSFTTNVGIGVNYNLSKRLKFNVEPMFKYQLNPYTDNSVNFKPYYIGVYSGLSFSF